MMVGFTIRFGQPAFRDTGAEGDLNEKDKITLYVKPRFSKRLKQLALQSGLTRGELVERALNRLHDRDLDLSPEAAREQAKRFRLSGLILADIAAKLNAQGYRTPLGKAWTYYTVQRMLAK
jgi:hypothetical protein